MKTTETKHSFHTFAFFFYNKQMKIYNSSTRFITFIFACTLVLIVRGQESGMGAQYYKIYDDFIGIENSELNNGTIYLQQLRTLDKSHMFYQNDKYIDGKVCYKGQVYQTKLKYDIYNDLIIVKYIESTNIYSLSLNSTLVAHFSIGKHRFVKLPNKGSISDYGNGFFEESFKGNNYSFYVKHKKNAKKNTEKSSLRYWFKDDITFLFSYQNNYYEVDSKKDIYKVLPQLKKQIGNHFNRYPKITAASLTSLFKQLDKIDNK